jgi:predicted dehydrogenase
MTDSPTPGSSSAETRVSRRAFQKTASAAAASAFAFQFVPSRVWGANERPALAGIGCGGKGESDIANSASAGFQVVGLVDVVDVKRIPEISDGMSRMKGLVAQREKYPDAKFYTDWREMLSDLGDKVDAVTISTPDHHHAHAAVAAMKAGKHVYCQKPLTHGIWEARMLAELARKTGVKTQMGNQAHANDHLRRCVELIRAGIIGKVKEVHAWTNRPIWPQGFTGLPPAEPVPAWMDWEQWIGPAPFVEYSSKIAPFAWRGWWNFGTGALGDMACHIMDMSWWALELGAPVAIQGKQTGGSEWSAPIHSTLTYEFAPNAHTVPEGLKYHWYDGQIGAEFLADKWSLKPGEFNRPNDVLAGFDHTESKGFGSVVVGEKGKLFFNRHKDTWIISPSSALDGFTDWPERSLPRARNQNPHDEWHDAVTGKIPQAESHFGLAGPFTEMVLLGCVAQRVPDVRLEWDAEKLEIKGRPDLKPLIQRDYRAGWELSV